MKVGRNDPCPCGSGRKYKHCCLAKDQAGGRTAGDFAADGAPGHAGENVDPRMAEQMMMRQAGLESTEELEAAMRRYELYCRNLAPGRSPESFMEFMGRPNAASETHRDLRALVEGQHFESEEDFERFLKSQVAAKGARPIDDFEGLSPEQMHRLLNRPIDTIGDIVEVVDPIGDEAAMESGLLQGIRWILDYLARHGGEIRLTARGNFPRVLCEGYLRECDPWWRQGMSVPTEGLIGELASAHQFATAFGYLGESKTKAWITTEGARVYASGRWGQAYPEMLRFTMDDLDWQQWLDESWRHEHFRIVQQAAPFILRLLRNHPTGSDEELYQRFATAFPLYAEPGSTDPASARFLRDVFAILALQEFCEPLGLVKLDYQRPEGDSEEEAEGGYHYETTRLFREALRWREASGG